MVEEKIWKWYYQPEKGYKGKRQGVTGGKGKRKIKKLNAKYRLKKKGINLITEELKQIDCKKD